MPKMISRYPRYLELHHKQFEPFSVQELRDLQVLNQMVWFDEDLLTRDAEIQGLIRKGRDYSLGDQTILARKQGSSGAFTQVGGALNKGVTGTVVLGVNPAATPAAVGVGGGGGARG